jgi:hypothetical protein
MTKRSGVIAGTAVLCSLLCAAATIVATTRTPQNEGRALRTRQLTAMHTGGLRAAAAIAGGFTMKAPVLEVGGPANLAELRDLSDVVLIGRVEDNRSQLSKGGRMIDLHYELSVERVLLGEVTSPKVEIVVPGGQVSFPDGSWARVTTPGFRLPENYRRYLLFLQVDSNESKEQRLVPTCGPLGVYCLSCAGRVMPSGYFRSPLAQELRRAQLEPDAFVESVTASVAR